MSVTVEARPESEREQSAHRPWRWNDYVFVVFFVAYTVGGLFVVLQGVGAVAAHLSPSFHESLHLRGLGTGFTARSAQRMADASHNLPSGLTTSLGFAFSVFNLALATFLLWLRPRDRTARLLAIGLVGTSGVFNLAAQSAFEALPLTPVESFAQAGAHIVAGLAYAFALVTFPDGRPVPRWPAPALAILYLPGVAGAAFLAARVQGTARPAALLIFFGLAVPAAGVLAQAYRFRRADSPTEHAQARLLFWALLPALGVGAWFVATQGFGAITEPVLAGRHLPESPTAVFRLFQPVFLLVPIALFVGLLRYRLWDIDRVVNRTLVYGLASGIVFGAYLVLVFLFQRLFNRFTGGSSLAVAASTLASAAAFVRVRRRIQDFVDRRFYRHRYDAQKTIEAFTSRLRDQVDLESLAFELRGVVARTIQPSHLTLLLKEPSGGLEWQWTYRGRGRQEE